MSIRTIQSGFEKGKYKPIQAYIDIGVLARFKAQYQCHGDITKLIRNAFAVAISEDELTEIAAAHAIETTMGPAPESFPLLLPCLTCVYPIICVEENQCAQREATRQF